jgi:CheY-like chemotaxis protein
VKSLVELHDGSVEAKSDGPGCGSRFAICLPALSSQRSRSAPENGGGEWSTVGKALRILVVNDNKDAATMLCMLFESMGHDVSAVHHSREALDRAIHQNYEAYLLDIGLPEIDGNELARRLRAMPSGKNTLMVAITGYGQQFDYRNALRAGFDHYFVKPVKPAKLAAVLADIDERKGCDR